VEERTWKLVDWLVETFAKMKVGDCWEEVLVFDELEMFHFFEDFGRIHCKDIFRVSGSAERESFCYFVGVKKNNRNICIFTQ
jgi:hypothetical protein